MTILVSPNFSLANYVTLRTKKIIENHSKNLLTINSFYSTLSKFFEMFFTKLVLSRCYFSSSQCRSLFIVVPQVVNKLPSQH